MNKRRHANPAAVAAGFVFLFTAPVLTRAQSSPPPPAEVAPRTSPLPQTSKARPDIFAGLQYTEDQKAKIDKIHDDIKSRVDAVMKDPKLSPDQKDAFLSGFERIERSEVYEVLTPEQKAEVGKRMLALRREAQKGRDKKQPPPQK